MSAGELGDLGPVALDGFEVWDRYVQAPAGSETRVAFVSIRKGGVVGLNKAAREMLGRCDAVRVRHAALAHNTRRCRLPLAGGPMLSGAGFTTLQGPAT
jgi:hypothetical protein